MEQDDPVVFSDRLHSGTGVFDEVKLSWVMPRTARARQCECGNVLSPFCLKRSWCCRKIPHGVICLERF